MPKRPVSAWAVIKAYRSIKKLALRPAAKVLLIPLQSLLLYEAKLKYPAPEEVKRISHISGIPEYHFYKPLPQIKKAMHYYINHYDSLAHYSFLRELKKHRRK